ncbi:MAG: Uma2 family endonuclease [Anaerolineaceae bacterium]|nr:Uma2 family endonuclease [Anaerolineaceae bacterium]
MVIPTLTEVQKIEGPPQGQWTYTDWEHLPDDENRYEVIDGVLYMSTSPSLYHQWIVQRFYRYVGIPAEDQKLGYMFLAPVGLIMAGVSPVQPDAVFIAAKNAAIMADKRIRGVPDLIAEVLSPGNKDYDEDVKLSAYARAGVPEYVVIDAWKKQLRLYSQPMEGEYKQLKKFNVGDTVTFAATPEIELAVGDLFAGSPDETL